MSNTDTINWIYAKCLFFSYVNNLYVAKRLFEVFELSKVSNLNCQEELTEHIFLFLTI